MGDLILLPSRIAILDVYDKFSTLWDEVVVFHEDTTIHTIATTAWTDLHSVGLFGSEIGVSDVDVRYRTTGAATAYVSVSLPSWAGDRVSGEYFEYSTTSTTTVIVYAAYRYVGVIYVLRTPNAIIRAKTSDSAIPCEVSYEKATVRLSHL